MNPLISWLFEKTGRELSRHQYLLTYLITAIVCHIENRKFVIPAKLGKSRLCTFRFDPDTLIIPCDSN